MTQKILAIRFGSLGDVILASAPLSNLRISFPGAKIVFLTKQRYRDTVGMMQPVDEIVCLPDNASQIDLFRLLLELDKQNFSHIIDLHGNFRSWFTRKFVKADSVAVYPKRRLHRARLVSRRKTPVVEEHTIDLYNHAVRQVGGSTPCNRPVLARPDSIEFQTPFPKDRPLVAMAPGAAHQNKQWELPRFVQTAQLLTEKTNAFCLWLLTTVDVAQLASYGLQNDESTLLFIDRTIPELADIIGRCVLTIANDSGIAHLSSAVATPTFAIFGPTHPALGFAPRGMHDRVIEVDEFCRPCSRHGRKPCYREERFCFTKISPKLVAEQATEMIDTRTRARPALFIDRDGTLIVNKHYLSDPDEVEFEPGAIDAVLLAREKGYRIVIISNQSGVGRGYFKIEDVERVNGLILEMMDSKDANPDGLYFCPHYPEPLAGNPFAIECNCRKPAGGMIEQAALDLNIDIGKSFIVGDTLADFNLSLSCGLKPLLVGTGHGETTRGILNDHGRPVESSFFQSLLKAVQSLPTAQ